MTMHLFLTCSSLSLFMVGVLCAENVTLDLMFISSGGGQYNSSGAEPAVDLAVYYINSRNIIPGYRLSIETRGNSSCERQKSLEAFLTNVSIGANKVAVVGCGCSLATLAVAEVSPLWNITHMAYSSSAPMLSDREKFPNFFRTRPSELDLADSVLAIMKNYGWKKLKIITEEEILFTGSTQRITEILLENNIIVDMNGTISFAKTDNITGLLDYYVPEVRIYLLNMYSIHARRLLCTAATLMQKQHTGLDHEFYFPGYVWITLAWYRDNWWTESVSLDYLPECPDQMLGEFLFQSIGILQANSAEDADAPTDVYLTAQDFKDNYVKNLEDRYSFEPNAYFAYDAIWALAFAIKRSIPYFDEKGISLANFSYATGSNFSAVIQEQMRRPDFGFTGVSGDVNFDENGTRKGVSPQIRMYRKSEKGIELVTVAVVNNTTISYVFNESVETVWPGGVPSDGAFQTVTVPVLLPLTIVYYILATSGIIFCIICLFFNIIFRKRKIVRLISPNLNYMVIAGGILLYTSVYFYTISTTNKFTYTLACHIRLWIQPLGYFCCFGTIMVKMWRVYYIFHNPAVKKKKRIPKDWHLFLFVMLMCSAVVVIGGIVAFIGQYKSIVVNSSERENSRNETTQVVIKYANLVCEGPYSLIWIGILYGYIFLTQIVAVILAFRTRKVTIKVLNDSKYLTIIIYVSTIILTAMIICTTALDEFLNTDAATFGGLILLFTTVVIGLIFIPKMVMLYKDPKGEKIFDRGQSQGTLNNIDDTNVEDLEQHCLDLEKRLSNYEEVIPFRSMPRLSSMQKYSMCGSVSSPMRSINSRSFTYSVAPLPTINKETVLPKEPVKNLAVSNGSELSSNEGKPDLNPTGLSE